MDFASLDCDSWINSFSDNGIVYLPAEINGPKYFLGKTQIAQYCAKHKALIVGSGAYPHDMYVSNDGTRVIFNMHIRAISKGNCFVDWLSILQIQIDPSTQTITKWIHYYDAEWMQPMIYCRSSAVATKKTEDIVTASLKPQTYEALLSFNSNCTEFALRFASTGTFSSPVGSSVQKGYTEIVARCNAINGMLAGAGNYAHDLYIGDNSVTFYWHIRAITKKCFVNWPGFASIQFDTSGKISSFEHFWDEDWTMAAINCDK